MHITRTDLTKTKVKLTISAEESELTPIKDGVVARLGSNVKLPGFRNGKAPAAMIEKAIDQNLLQGDFLDEAMTQLYAKATVEEDIRPVTRPNVTVKKFVPFSQLEFEVETDIIGKITLPDYKKISVPSEPVKISEKDVNEVVSSLQTRLAEKVPVKRAAKNKDEAVIDFKGADAKGEPIPNADGTDYPLVLGSNAFIPGFEDNVVGMKPGDEKSFEIAFPQDYGAKTLAGTKVTFTVTLKVLNEMKEPALDDEFAAKVGPFKTLNELKADIKKQLTAEREQEAQANRQEAILKEISKKTKVEIPEALIEQQVTYNLDELRRNLTYRGQTFQEFLENEGKTEDEYKKEIEPQATEQLKASLILSEIAELEKFSVEPDELKIRIQALKGQYNDPQMQAELDKPENQRDIASRMLSEKVMAFLTEK